MDRALRFGYLVPNPALPVSGARAVVCWTMDHPAPGPPPPEGDLDRRVVALETDMREVKAGIGRLETGLARTDARLEGLTDRVTALEGSVNQLRTSTQASIEELRTSTQASFDEARRSTQASFDEARRSTQAAFDEMRNWTQASLNELRTKTEESNKELRTSIKELQMSMERSMDSMRVVIYSRILNVPQMLILVTTMITVFLTPGGAMIGVGHYLGVIH